MMKKIILMLKTKDLVATADLAEYDLSGGPDAAYCTSGSI
jgi:hypothetical protein